VSFLLFYIAFSLFTFLWQISLFFLFLRFICIQLLSVFLFLVKFLKTLIHSKFKFSFIFQISWLWQNRSLIFRFFVFKLKSELLLLRLFLHLSFIYPF
jgi:hypothetical protein